MNKLLLALASACLIFSVTSARAADDYNKPPAGDKVYAQCLKTSNSKWEGGNDKSAVKGQTNAQAFCTCMWNETPDDFKGNLATFSESAKGKSVNKMCEKHSGWGE
ncbi:hypothetical protein SAMN05216344_109124 [Polaromonas sp. OV174]|uniref:hypothetical protein n=1 Tax=Polaromonas sp. OV174 TaxID=1855300 RepID=UPI0008DFD547|nr:hypothetical protein [Polaromonas sp. OV174]SFC12288.1 hypothetical protein SAMN05216344_109124 [Polaromonas sp. OV174]